MSKRIISTIFAALLVSCAFYGCEQISQIPKENGNKAEEKVNIENKPEIEEELTEETAEEENNNIDNNGTKEEDNSEESVLTENTPEQEASHKESETEDTSEASKEASEETAMPENEASANDGSETIDIETKKQFNIPELELWGITAEDFTVTFGVDLTSVNLAGFDEMTPEEKMQLFSLLNITENGFTKEDYEKLTQMDFAELMSFIKEKVEFFSSLKKLVEGAGIDVSLDSVNGEIVMKSALVFEFDKTDVSDDGKKLINKLVEIYSVILNDQKLASYLNSVIIEGHTDNNGSYEYNLELSEKRAENVLNYCISEETGASEETRSKLTQLLSSRGCSESQPVYTEDGVTVDADASRRVAFRFLINIE